MKLPVILFFLGQVTGTSIWIGEPTNSTLKPINVNAIIFYDENGNVKLITFNNAPSPPNPEPSPNPVPNPLPVPIPPAGKFGIAPIVSNLAQSFFNTNKITKAEISALAKAYRDTVSEIDTAKVANATLTKEDVQNSLIIKTHKALGNNLSNWIPLLDQIVANMKSNQAKLTTFKEFGDYYSEVASGLETISRTSSKIKRVNNGK